MTHPARIREEALALVAQGINDCEIARRLGVSRTTVRDWRRPKYIPREHARPSTPCPRCWEPAVPVICSARDYALLLGWYLGDGHISDLARTQRLRFSCDARYGRINAELVDTLDRCFCFCTVGSTTRDGGSTFVPHVYSSHLGCLFPQHGAGKKHEREIRLEPWQQRLVIAAPWDLLKGLIYSDGCHFINRTGRYQYLSYEFKNLAAGILDLFCATCDQVQVAYRRYAKCVRIYRRPSVALLQENVGLKY